MRVRDTAPNPVKDSRRQGWTLKRTQPVPGGRGHSVPVHPSGESKKRAKRFITDQKSCGCGDP